jgi:hypothetical protein
MTPVEVLEATKTQLIKHGWRKYTWGPLEGPNCTEGALIFAGVGNNESRIQATLFLRSAIATRNGEVVSIVDWNDQATTTFDDIMAALDDAILAAKEEEAGHVRNMHGT